MKRDRTVPTNAIPLDPNFFVYVFGRFILSLGFLIAGVYTLHKGFDLYSTGVGLYSDGSHVSGSGEAGEIDVSLKTVGSVVMMTSVVWGIIAFFTLPKVKYQSPYGSFDAKLAIKEAEFPSKKYLDNIFLRPFGSDPNIESRDFQRGINRAKTMLNDGRFLLYCYPGHFQGLKIDDNNRCLFFEYLKTNLGIEINWDRYYYHYIGDQRCQIIAGFNSVMLTAIKAKYGDDILVHAERKSQNEAYENAKNSPD